MNYRKLLLIASMLCPAGQAFGFIDYDIDLSQEAAAAARIALWAAARFTLPVDLFVKPHHTTLGGSPDEQLAELTKKLAKLIRTEITCTPVNAPVSPKPASTTVGAPVGATGKELIRNVYKPNEERITGRSPSCQATY